MNVKDLGIAFALALLALLLRVIIPFHPLAEASCWYWFLGARLAEGHWNLIGGTDEGVLYLLLIAAGHGAAALLAWLGSIFGTPAEVLLTSISLSVARGISLLASCTSVALVFALGARCYSRAVGACAALLLATSVLDIRFAAAIQYNSLFVCLLLGAALLTIRVGAAPDSGAARRRAWLAGGVVAATALVRLTALLLPAAALAALWLRSERPIGREARRAYLIPVAAAAATWAILTLWGFGGLDAYLELRRTNQPGVWAALAAGRIDPAISALWAAWSLGLKVFLAVERLPWSESFPLPVAWLVHPPGTPHPAYGPLLALALLAGTAATRQRWLVLFAAAHFVALGLYEADARYALFSLPLLSIIALGGVDGVFRALLPSRIATLALIALTAPLLAARSTLWDTHRDQVVEGRALRATLDGALLGGYAEADRLLARHRSQTREPDRPGGSQPPPVLLVPSALIDLCAILESDVRLFDADPAADADELRTRIDEVDARYLIFWRLSGPEAGELREQLGRVSSFGSDDIRALTELSRAASRVVEQQPERYRAIGQVQHFNQAYRFTETVAVVEVRSPPGSSPPRSSAGADPDADCLGNCCFEYQLPL